MPRIVDATPRISVHLYKTISRETIDGQKSVSTRYKGKDAFIDLTNMLGEGSAVRTTKSVREPAGAFSITFADKPLATGPGGVVLPMGSSLESIYGLVEPMDVVEIRMWNGVGPRPAKLPIKMRGFVSDVQREQTMGDDGRPIRQVVVTGQDYGKIWQTYQVIYLAAYSEGKDMLTSYALNELFGFGAVNAMSAPEFIRRAVQKIINPQIKGFMPENSPMPKQLETGDSISVKHGMVNMSYQEMQGSIYDILRFHGDVGVWNELYTEDREDGVHVVYRSIPALLLSPKDGSRKIMEDAPDPVYVGIHDSAITSISVTRTDATVANFFWVNNSRFDLIDEMQRKLSAIPADDRRVSLKDYPNAAPKYYGTRPMFAETQQGDSGITNMTSGLPAGEQSTRSSKQEAWIDKRRRQMLEMNKDNVVYERGTARIKGGPMRVGGKECMKAGDYAQFIIGNMTSEGYVVQMDDEFLPYQGYTTTLIFERGTGFAERTGLEGGRQSPWLAEQATFTLNGMMP